MNSTRRDKLPQNPACESLEGRQLLTAGANLGLAQGMPPTGTIGPADISMTGLGNAPSGHGFGRGDFGGREAEASLGIPGMAGLGGPGGFAGHGSFDPIRGGFDGAGGSQGVGLG